MKEDYLLVLSNGAVMREVELDADLRLVRVGTTPRCEVRFMPDLFFSSFELEFMQVEDGMWQATCSDEVYLGGGGVQKRSIVRLSHGDSLLVRYTSTNATLLTLNFSINFERERGSYDRWIDLRGRDVVSMGGMPNCMLVFNSPYTMNDLLALRRVDAGFELAVERSRYGVMCDGALVEGQTRLVNGSFFNVACFYFYYRDERLYFSQAAPMGLHGVACYAACERAPYSTYPKFNRSTRVKTVLNDEPVEILEPPAKPDKPQGNIVLRLLPALGMLAVTVFLRGTLLSGMSSSSFIIVSAASTCVGLLTTLLTYVADNRNYKKALEERDSSYRAYIDQKREEVLVMRKEELRALLAAYPSPAEELASVRDFSGDLFERRPIDDDFLHVRLGLGNRESVRPLAIKERETFEVDELAQLPAALRDELRYISGAPVTVDFLADGAVGVVGAPVRAQALLCAMVVDLVTHHHESEVQLAFVVEPRNERLVQAVRQLPHVRNDALHRRNIACDDESKTALFEQLYRLLTERQAKVGDDVGESAASGAFLPHYVVFLWDEYGFKNHPLSRFVDDAARLGVTFVFFEPVRELLPQGCAHLVELDARANAGVLVCAQNSRESQSFSFESVSEAEVRDMATTLAPVYVEEVSLEGELTKSISLFELLGIMGVDDLDLDARWKASQVHKSLSAPIGVSKTHVVRLDLHDKAHGPHGLVAGTTGSGKSEALQTYILSMATLFHPYEVGFMIIDFKGGGMVNQFRDLPHLMGAITNIDGREIDRSLMSIKAELQKRQRLFAQAGVNHIDAYIKKYHAGELATPLPHLIMIVDEFAELKAEQPEFMKELISTSRIGRSLGVHLILATQKPAGQVSEQIWSNSRFKLCLKVASKQDSNEVLKSPLAAEIKEPGRAYLQVGNNEIFELFQSAYSGAPERVDEDAMRAFTLYEVGTSGRRVPIYQRKRSQHDGSGATQLEAIVGHVARYCERVGLDRLPSICLPPLPERIDFPDRARRDRRGTALGVYDDPSSQYQGEVLLDVEGSNMFIVGSAQTGKTNLLQAIIRSVASTQTPDQAVFYIMDFGSMVLKNFEGMAHVGGVVLPSEDERVKNLFKLLDEEMGIRRKRLLEAGVSSFGAYVEAGNVDLPHIYVLLDNFAVFKELYAERYESDMLSLCRDGLTCGISVVVANATTSGFGFRYLSNFSTGIAFTCNDTGEYSNVFGRCRIQPKNVPGRALCSLDKNIYEFQAYLAFAGEREVDRVGAMRSFVDDVNRRCSGRRARRIPCVPEELGSAYIRQNYEVAPTELAFALDYATVEPVRLPLESQFSLAVVGKDARKRDAVVHALLAEVRGLSFEQPFEVHIVDGLAQGLRRWANEPFVAGYTSDYTQASLVLEDLAARLQGRYELVGAEGMRALEGEPWLLAVLNAPEAVAHLSASKDLVALYGEISKRYAAMRVLFVFSGVADAGVPFSGAPLLKAIKEERRGIVTTALADHKFYDVPSVVARAHKGRLEDGQAFLVQGADVSRIKVAQEGVLSHGAHNG